MAGTDDEAYLRLYEPIDTLEPVADDIWVVDGPVIRMAFPLGLRVPFTTRMTVVRLSDGGLWVHSPTRLTPSLRAEIEAEGPVRHLVAPNFLHYAWIPDWSEAFPDATCWAAPGVRERAAGQGIEVRFDADLGDEPPPAWADDLDQLMFRGSRILQEVVFFHRQSRTAILADLIQNHELDRVAPRWRWLMRCTGAVDPDGRTPIDVRATFLGGRAAARASLEGMLAWQPERVVFAHGRWYEENGTEELRRAFRWL